MCKMKRWTKEEEEILKNNYRYLGAKEISKRLIKCRTINCIRHKASYLKIKFYKPKRKTFCKLCGTKTCNNNNKQNLRLCKSCSAKSKYYNRKDEWHNGKLFTEQEVRYIKENYWMEDKKKIMNKLNRSWSSIIHKANRLGLKRNRDFFRSKYTKKFNLTNNPMWRKEVKEKQSKSILKYIQNNPHQLLNRRLKRNHITSIEKKVKRVLDKNNISYLYDKYVKVKGTYKFPDFRIGKLIIECDGSRFHQDKEKEKKRDRLLINEGYTLLHFSEGKINKNIKEVERCILKKLNQLNIQEKRKLTI